MSGNASDWAIEGDRLFMPLPVFQTTGEIIEYCWTYRYRMAVYAAVPVLITIVANIAGWLLGADLTDPRGPVFMLLTFINGIVFLPFIVTWYRSIILGEQDLATRPLFTLRGLEGRMLVWQIITGLIVLAVGAAGALLISAVISALTPILGGAAEVLAALGLGMWGVMMIAVMCRISLVFAMAATGRPVILSEAWSKSQGLGVRMAGIFALCILCVAVLVIPLQFIVFVATAIVGLIAEGAAESAGIVLEIILSVIASVLIYALPATLFAFVYSRIAEAMTRGAGPAAIPAAHHDLHTGQEEDASGSSEDEVNAVLARLGTYMEGKPRETPNDLRTLLDGYFETFPLPAEVTVDDVQAEGVPAQWITAPDSDKDKVILLLHGGAFVAGNPVSHRRLAAALSEACGVRVLLPDYRLAPEYPYPAGLDDCVIAYRWLLDSGFKPGHIVIVGDSAGGGLAFSTALRLKELGVDQPAALVAISPWANLTCDGETMETKAQEDPVTNRDQLLPLADLYLNGHDAKDPKVSPIYGDLRGLPPALIQVGSREVLLDDSRKLAVRARADDVPVALEEWPGMFHVWHMWADDLTDGRRALGGIGMFVRKCMG